MNQKLLFIDRDGTLIKEPDDEQIDSLAKLQFYPEVFKYLGKIARELNFELVMVTNQDGLGTAEFPEDNFWPLHKFIIQTFENEGVVFKEQLIDRTFAKDQAHTRKPNTGLLTEYLKDCYDLENSFVIGDRLTDVELAKNLACKALYINDNSSIGFNKTTLDKEQLKTFIALETKDWKEIYTFLKVSNRTGSVKRSTNETEVTISLDLDGTGQSNIETGIPFFDHMLTQIAKHGQLDMDISTVGDLEVDEHHTIEDTAIVLGEVMHQALGNKLGIERYGFCLPMDDCLAQVSIDFGGRNWLVWEADFKREMIGKMPTEMFYHFFKSFTDGAKCNLNIKAEGINEHHKIEAIFKTFAKALKMAAKRDVEKMILPSTKGTLS